MRWVELLTDLTIGGSPFGMILYGLAFVLFDFRLSTFERGEASKKLSKKVSCRFVDTDQRWVDRPRPFFIFGGVCTLRYTVITRPFLFLFLFLVNITTYLYLYLDLDLDLDQTEPPFSYCAADGPASYRIVSRNNLERVRSVLVS